MSGINYDDKIFRPVESTANGEVSQQTVFHYKQNGHVLTSSYRGGKVREGHLIGLVDEEGNIDMRYHQVNEDGQLRTGICRSTPEILTSGKMLLYEKWQWTSGDNSKGTSTLEEITGTA